MYGVVSYNCATAAGDSTDDLWRALQTGADLAHDRTLRFVDRGEGTDLDILTRKLSRSFRLMMENAPREAADRLLKGGYGVILASTKGRTGDFIWNPTAEQLREDPLTPLLNQVLERLELKPLRSVVVSNACSSALAASRLAQLWLHQGMTDVLVLAADVVSDFVLRGFDSLKLLSNQPPRSFAANRDGFLLGEAAACLWLSQSVRDARARIHTVGLDSEGSAVTRPTASGASLVRAAEQISDWNELRPELVIAHGTGTQINDQTEDLAFSRLLPHRPFITGSKWCVGHTLAASAAVDMILACEIFRRQDVFTLHTTENVDPSFHGRYLTRGSTMPAPSRILVSSLGFGGMHASAVLEANR
jgi:3-oxoacyl-[acyl-carrier-protein] synthase-1